MIWKLHKKKKQKQTDNGGIWDLNTRPEKNEGKLDIDNKHTTRLTIFVRQTM